MQQEAALNVLRSGKNIFLTGAPGAGKTYVLNQYIEWLRKHDITFHVTASTGIAASHLNGMTLHSYSGLGIDTTVDDQFLRNLLSKKAAVVNRMKKTQVLIIDEISMVPPGIFAAVDTILRRIRFNDTPFGGVQIVIAGDFFQLPPVERGRSFGEQKEYVWQSEQWRDLDPTVCYLSERYRHDDPSFLAVLDEIRAQEVTEESMDALRECYRRDLGHETYTRLYTHNRDVDSINSAALAQMDSQPYKFEAVTTGRARDIEMVFKNTLVNEELILKEGAKVIFIKNDQKGEYVNGTIGTVTGFSEDRSWPIVTTIDDRTISTSPDEWNRQDTHGDTVATVRQLPLRLAWAITVHKSQGMTLDAAEMDLSQAFEVGQGYVALSRVKNLAGLRLMGLNDIALKVDPTVVLYDERLKTLSEKTETQALSNSDEQWKELHDNFIEDADGTLEPLSIEEVTQRVATKIKEKKKKKSVGESALETEALIKEGYSPHDVAIKRDVAFSTVIGHLQLLAAERGLPRYKSLKVDASFRKKIKIALKSIIDENHPDHFSDSGLVRRGEIRERLGEEFEYDEINLALLYIDEKDKKRKA